MNVRLKPETESLLLRLAASTGRAADELVEDAMAGYLAELSDVRSRLDQRDDEWQQGRAKLIDGESFFESLRVREEELTKKHLPK